MFNKTDEYNPVYMLLKITKYETKFRISTVQQQIYNIKSFSME